MRHFVLLAAFLAAAPAFGAEIPRYVAGPASGLQQECRDARQPVPRLEALVTEVADLDGDGQPDHVIDSARGCEAVRLLYCNDGGCSIDVYLTSETGYGGGWKAQRWRLDRTSRPATLSITTTGELCDTAGECTVGLRWAGEMFRKIQ